jgi:hypothetical protein
MVINSAYYLPLASAIAKKMGAKLIQDSVHPTIVIDGQPIQFKEGRCSLKAEFRGRKAWFKCVPEDNAGDTVLRIQTKILPAIQEQNKSEADRAAQLKAEEQERNKTSSLIIKEATDAGLKMSKSFMGEIHSDDVILRVDSKPDTVQLRTSFHLKGTNAVKAIVEINAIIAKYKVEETE